MATGVMFTLPLFGPRLRGVCASLASVSTKTTLELPWGLDTADAPPPTRVATVYPG